MEGEDTVAHTAALQAPGARRFPQDILTRLWFFATLRLRFPPSRRRVFAVRGGESTFRDTGPSS
jgi:hypothetical protein